MKIIVTSGATREPVDSVRYLSNVSTGGTAAGLADVLGYLGHQIVFLRGEGSVVSKKTVASDVFTTAEDLRKKLSERLSDGSYDAVIMAAAVADYRPVAMAQGKLSSDAPEMTLSLVRNPKILSELKGYSPKQVKVIGFKLTSGATEEERLKAVQDQFANGLVDAVVHNDIEEIRREGVHPFWVYPSATAKAERIDGAAALAATLNRILSA